MSLKLVKLKEVEYNETLTIALIEKDTQLKSIFGGELKLSFEMLITLSKEDKLSIETKELIRSIFDDVILTQSDLINRYLYLAKADGIKLTETPTEIPEPIVEEVVEVIKEVKVKKENALPRRYGADKILKDIQQQGGKATNVQSTALAVNKLKNMYVNINSRLIKDMLLDKKILTDEDYRDIKSAISIVEQKLKHILKKK